MTQRDEHKAAIEAKIEEMRRYFEKTKKLHEKASCPPAENFVLNKYYGLWK